MKKIILIAVAVALVVSLFAASCAPKREEEALPKSISIVDSAGRTVEVPQPLNKVIVVYSHLLLTTKGLGIGDEVIVGLDEFTLGQYKEIFPGLSEKPTIGQNFFHLDLEKIIALDPQVLITLPFALKKLPELEATLESAGIKVVALDFKLGNVQDVIKTLGKMFGKERRAEEYSEFWFSKLDMVQERVNALKDEEKVRVYWENTMTPYKTVSKEGKPHELLNMAGGLNIAQDLMGSYPEVDPEWVITQDPDMILKYPMGAEYQGGFGKTDTEPFEEMRHEIMERPGFDQIKAVKEGKVYILSQIIKGGAFENVGICYIAKLLYPDLFKDLDPEAYLEEMIEEYYGLNFDEVKGVFVYPKPF